VRGAEVYARLKDEVSRRGLVQSAYVTRTFCLGVCPHEGCTVRSWPSGTVYRDVVPDDAAELLENVDGSAAGGTSQSRTVDDDGLKPIEDLQREKVLALARRLKPGLTLEDVQNPHDFPELDDCDWHYEDGVLTGIQTVRTALRARAKR
jgi:(2Fe-2S) ferredoxin